MKTNIATTRNQAARLLKCGVPAESADMLHNESTGLEVNVSEEIPSGYNPAWSLSALLELLPKEIKSDGTTYKLNIDYPPIGQVAVRYNTEEDDLDSLFGLMGDDLFELIVLMVEKLTANGYRLNDYPCREKGGRK